MGGSRTTWYFRVFLVGSRSYSVIIGGSDTINGVSGRFRYKLQYLRLFLEGSRSYSVIMGGFHPGDSGVILRSRRACDSAEGVVSVLHVVVKSVPPRKTEEHCREAWNPQAG